MPKDSLATGVISNSFAGFESLDSNYIYCPNQFFDVCLPHCRRGVVRLVAFMLVETLRWRDEDGSPINEEIAVKYTDLTDRAGISRGSIDGVISEAIGTGFIECIVPARRKSKGQSAQTAQYKLRWSRGTTYQTDPKLFDGLYSGDGHCSPVPLAFFTLVVPSEPLADIRFVGAVLRHTVGFENKYGRRRPKAPLSFDTIKQYANYADRQQAVKAAKRCISKGYICRVERGEFSPDESIRKPSTYAPKWLDGANKIDIGSKVTSVPNSSNMTPGLRFNNDPNNGSKETSAQQFRKDPIRKTQEKETLQQHTDSSAVSEDSAAVSLLRDQGFDLDDARTIAAGRTTEQINQQVRWLNARNPKNPLAMLRTAIEQDWDAPTGAEEQKAESLRQQQDVVRRSRNAQTAEVEGKLSDDGQQRKVEQRQWRLEQWGIADITVKQLAYARALSRSDALAYQKRIKDSTDSNPASEVLAELERIIQPERTAT